MHIAEGETPEALSDTVETGETQIAERKVASAE